MTGAGARSALSALAISFSIMPMSSSMVVLLLGLSSACRQMSDFQTFALERSVSSVQVQLDYAHADIGAAACRWRGSPCGPSASRRA